MVTDQLRSQNISKKFLTVICVLFWGLSFSASVVAAQDTYDLCPEEDFIHLCMRHMALDDNSLAALRGAGWRLGRHDGLYQHSFSVISPSGLYFLTTFEDLAGASRGSCEYQARMNEGAREEGKSWCSFDAASFENRIEGQVLRAPKRKIGNTEFLTWSFERPGIGGLLRRGVNDDGVVARISVGFFMLNKGEIPE